MEKSKEIWYFGYSQREVTEAEKQFGKAFSKYVILPKWPFYTKNKVVKKLDKSL